MAAQHRLKRYTQLAFGQIAGNYAGCSGFEHCEDFSLIIKCSDHGKHLVWKFFVHGGNCVGSIHPIERWCDGNQRRRHVRFGRSINRAEMIGMNNLIIGKECVENCR